MTDFCRICANCQILKSLKSFQELLLIIFLQSLDIMNIDYIDSITFIVKSETRFMCIFVDYFTRYLFADVMSFVIFENTIIFFERFVMQHFDWSQMIYFDNESHFKRDFNEKLKKQKMKHYFASISHSRLIELTKKYVRIVLQVFWAILQHDFNMIFEWDFLLSVVVKAMNIKMIKAFKYSFA